MLVLPFEPVLAALKRDGMEKWLAENFGTILTIASVIGSFAFSYGKLKASLSIMNERLNDMGGEIEKLKGGGVPVLCGLHEARLTRVEAEIHEHASNMNATVEEIRNLAAKNHDLILSMMSRVRPPRP